VSAVLFRELISPRLSSEQTLVGVSLVFVGVVSFELIPDVPQAKEVDSEWEVRNKDQTSLGQ
jgi:hypothetical protein